MGPILKLKTAIPTLVGIPGFFFHASIWRDILKVSEKHLFLHLRNSRNYDKGRVTSSLRVKMAYYVRTEEADYFLSDRELKRKIEQQF